MKNMTVAIMNNVFINISLNYVAEDGIFTYIK